MGASEIERIVGQMHAAIEGEAWHGPHVKKILDGIDARTAAAKPIPGAHSIWEILLHLTGTQTLLFRRFEGDPTYITPEEDFPAMPEVTEANWQATRQAYFDREQRLRDLVAKYPAARLDEPLVAGGTTAYSNFHGHVQHTLYHAAQMGLLRKLLAGTKGGR